MQADAHLRVVGCLGADVGVELLEEIGGPRRRALSIDAAEPWVDVAAEAEGRLQLEQSQRRRRCDSRHEVV